MSEVTWYFYTFLGSFGPSFLVESRSARVAAVISWWCASRIIYEATR